MATAGGQIESFYASGMLEIRSSLHLAVRLTMRAIQVIDQSGAASEGAGLWRIALPAFVVLDVIVWLVLRRGDDFGLAWRLPLDAADATFWNLSPRPTSGSADVALFIVIPLAVEAGVRMALRGMIVPAVVLVPTTAAAVVSGQPVQVAGLVWLSVAVLVGMAFFRYCGHQHEMAERKRQRVLGAARRRAFLAGQNQVAMGASSTVDAIEGLVPVLGRPHPGSALWELAEGWKGRLSASTTEDAKYLQVALLEWERLHNAHPDLSGLVQVQVNEGHGTTLLSAGQVGRLSRALDRLGLRQRVTVKVHEPGSTRLPGEELSLDVNGTKVVVAADGRSAPPALDPAAVAYFYVIALVAAWILPLGGSVPLPLVTVGLATCGIAGIAAHRQTAGPCTKARRCLWLAVAVATVLTLVHSTARSPITADGNANLGFGVGVILLAFIGGFYWDSLGAWRWLVPATVVVNTGLAMALFPIPRAVDARSVTVAILGGIYPFVPCRHLTRALNRVSARHAHSSEAAGEEAVRRSYAEGRDSVVSLVREARQDAVRQLELLGPRLDVRLGEFAALRLREVDRRLSTLDP